MLQPLTAICLPAEPICGKNPRVEPRGSVGAAPARLCHCRGYRQCPRRPQLFHRGSGKQAACCACMSPHPAYCDASESRGHGAASNHAAAKGALQGAARKAARASKTPPGSPLASLLQPLSASLLLLLFLLLLLPLPLALFVAGASLVCAREDGACGFHETATMAKGPVGAAQ